MNKVKVAGSGKILDLEKAGNSEGPSHVKLKIASDAVSNEKPVIHPPEKLLSMPFREIEKWVERAVEARGNQGVIQATLQHELQNGKRMKVVSLLQKALMMGVEGNNLTESEIRKIAVAAGVGNNTIPKGIEETPGEEIVITKDGARIGGKPFTSSAMKNKYRESSLPVNEQAKIWSSILG